MLNTALQHVLVLSSSNVPIMAPWLCFLHARPTLRGCRWPHHTPARSCLCVYAPLVVACLQLQGSGFEGAADHVADTCRGHALQQRLDLAMSVAKEKFQGLRCHWNLLEYQSRVTEAVDLMKVCCPYLLFHINWHSVAEAVNLMQVCCWQLFLYATVYPSLNCMCTLFGVWGGKAYCSLDMGGFGVILLCKRVFQGTHTSLPSFAATSPHLLCTYLAVLPVMLHCCLLLHPRQAKAKAGSLTACSFTFTFTSTLVGQSQEYCSKSIRSGMLH